MSNSTSDEKNVVQPPPPIRPDLARMLLEPVNHGFAAAERAALKHGVPAEQVIEMVLNHLASLVSMIEPAGAREETLKQLVASFGPLVRQHYQARHTTPGGVLVPPGKGTSINGEVKDG